MPTLRHFPLIPLALVSSLIVLGPARGQIHQLGELNTEQICALDRQKTVVLIPGGIMEEHGPYLPAYTDGFTRAFLAGELAKASVARLGWKVVVFPQIPLGLEVFVQCFGETKRERILGEGTRSLFPIVERSAKRIRNLFRESCD